MNLTPSPFASVVYRWRYRDPIRKRRFTSHHMTVEDAAKWLAAGGITEFERIDSTFEVREPIPMVQPSGKVMRAPEFD